MTRDAKVLRTAAAAAALALILLPLAAPLAVIAYRWGFRSAHRSIDKKREAE